MPLVPLPSSRPEEPRWRLRDWSPPNRVLLHLLTSNFGAYATKQQAQNLR